MLLFYQIAHSYNNYDKNVNISISQNDLIIVSDVNNIMKYSKAKNLSDRALDQVKIADEAYSNGVKL